MVGGHAAIAPNSDRYVASTITLEIHDAFNEHPNCRRGGRPEHERWYDTFARAAADAQWDTCYWCIAGPTGHDPTVASALARLTPGTASEWG